MPTPFIDFRPAQVMGQKEVYVCYYVVDPTSDKLKRMRIRCNRIRNPRERTRYAALLCSEINRKLYNGWNPLIVEDSAASKRVSIVEAATNFVRQKEKTFERIPSEAIDQNYRSLSDGAKRPAFQTGSAGVS
ncbi:MAG: hypothetical protein PUB29_08470 [Bacteroidales bacterium]|nr:hypothetical protein [Bacteroidales bacterium]